MEEGDEGGGGGGVYSCVKCWLVDEDASVMQMWIECEETKRMRKCSGNAGVIEKSFMIVENVFFFLSFFNFFYSFLRRKVKCVSLQ